MSDDDYTTRAISRPDWFDDRACADVDTRVFFAMQGEALLTEIAKGICAKCPVAEQCLQHALDNGERFGVWGGKSERERRAIRRERRIANGEQVRELRITHGAVTTYQKHGCRCEPCRLANRAYQRQRALNGPAPKPASAACGTNAAYVAHYRRGEKPCDDCVAARAAYVAERNNKEQAA